MSKLFRRVLLVLVLLAAAVPWFGITPRVHGQDGPAQSSDTDPNAEQAVPDQPAGKPSAGSITVPTGGMIAVIEFDGAIQFDNQIESVKRRTERAIQQGADLIVFDLDTPGGRLDLAVDLTAYIRNLKVPTVAWVNDRALSAGILIASACDELVMAKGALTGDCSPIVPGRNLEPSERAKALSYLLAEFEANAQANYSGPSGDDYAMFHAMCVLGIRVYQVRNPTTGEVRLVSQADYAVMVDGQSPINVANIGPTQAGSALVDPDSNSGEDLGRPKLTATQADMGQWEFVKLINDGSLFLTMNNTAALDAGLSRATISSRDQLKQHYGASTLIYYEETWSESLVAFLVHPVVRAALLLLGIAGVLIEYLSPGLFIPGIVGLAAFAVLIGAPFLVGLAQTWHLVLIVVGAALLIYELFTMTTFGVLAVLGLLMFLAGLVLSGVQSATNGLPASGSEVVITSMSFVGAVLLTVPLLILVTKYFGSLPLFNKLILNESQTASLPVNGSVPLPYQRLAGDESVGGGTIHVGMTGTVSSTGLRPGGRIAIQDQLIDVTSTGGFIEPGTAVRVVEVHGNMISVESVESVEPA